MSYCNQQTKLPSPRLNLWEGYLNQTSKKGININLFIDQYKYSVTTMLLSMAKDKQSIIIKVKCKM